jgi:predicted N-acetyltransferase YhbS
MTELALTVLPETPADAVVIERLHERTFGPGRYARTAFRIRERAGHLIDLSFTARIGTLLVGSVRLTPIRIGETTALLLGPLTVEPPFRRRGIGLALMQRALAEAKHKGHRLVVLVGDEPYYAKAGFKRIPKGQARMPGPVNPERLLVAELAEGAFTGVSGPIRPEWETASTGT